MAMRWLSCSCERAHDQGHQATEQEQRDQDRDRQFDQAEATLA
jgi:hypothetical protein